VIVTNVWSGGSSPDDTLTFYHDYRIGMDRDQSGLFMADSTGRLTIHGLPEDGFFIMVGRSAPNVLTVDDLRCLSSGRVPVFNRHTSVISVHFPLSSEEERIRVYPDGDIRIAESDYDDWDGREVYGDICTGPGHSSELGMYHSPDTVSEAAITFRGDVRRYDDNVYYLDLWPVYPAVASTEAYEAYCEDGTIPVYAFAIKVGNTDPWPAGLPEEAYLIADGRDFYLTGRQMFVPRETGAGMVEGPDMQFSAFASSGERYSSRKAVLMMEDLDTSSGRPILMTMLEAIDDDDLIHASLWYKESGESDPVFFSECRLELSPPDFTIETDIGPENLADLDGSIFTFDDTGRAVLEYDGHRYDQIRTNPGLHTATIRPHNSALFVNPEDEDGLLLFHCTTIGHYSNHADISDMMVARMIDNLLWEDSISGTLYEVGVPYAVLTEITAFTLHRR
jgi:hypothetical protein